jgi:hypothetical protein
MAADLSADLDEAEAEGGTPEDVLGNSAFDPRRFAAAWAVARGVTGPPAPEARPSWRSPVAVVAVALLGALVVAAGFVLLVGRGSSSIAVVTHRIAAAPGSIRFLPTGPRRMAVPGPLGPFVGTQVAGVTVHPLAFLLLAVGVMGLVVLGLLALWYWSPWPGPRRFRRHGGPRTPGWN